MFNIIWIIYVIAFGGIRDQLDWTPSIGHTLIHFHANFNLVDQIYSSMRVHTLRHTITMHIPKAIELIESIVQKMVN